MVPHTFQVVSFGCKVNQAEGEALAERLTAMGLEEAAEGAAADLVVVNTCSVTAEAARQGRQAARRAGRAGAAVVVTGCDAHEAAADRGLGRIEGVRVAGPAKDAAIAVARDLWPELAAPPAPGAATAARPGRSRALLKVQDGCPAACAYCLVRLVRPTVRSRPPEAAAREVRRLVAAGFREVVLCGIHLGLYGADLEEQTDLAGLVDRLLAVPGLGRLRLSSLEPMEVTDALLARMAAAPERVCPHLHLPLQSGDDAVLARMNRPYTAEAFLETVIRVRAALATPAVTTDVLAGFPGETEAAFEQTLDVLRAAGVSRVHAFPFSARPGTAAAAMPDPVPRAVAKDRRARAAALGAALGRAYRASLVGRTETVAVERVAADGAAGGLAARYERVRVAGPLPPGTGRRDLVRVRLGRATEDGLEGEPR